jgi:beta-lactamase superfamily II metal-dependent hydrolase
MLLVAGCGNVPPPDDTIKPDPQSSIILSVHHIDVGQGDAAFVELPDDWTMLINTGYVGNGKAVTDYIMAN